MTGPLGLAPLGLMQHDSRCGSIAVHRIRVAGQDAYKMPAFQPAVCLLGRLILLTVWRNVSQGLRNASQLCFVVKK
jgi:hypothetical protein